MKRNNKKIRKQQRRLANLERKVKVLETRDHLQWQFLYEIYDYLSKNINDSYFATSLLLIPPEVFKKLQHPAVVRRNNVTSTR